jgi:GNAT superfamily N-acetyltransferase
MDTSYSAKGDVVVNCIIEGLEYGYSANAILREDTRKSFFLLANRIFGLDFEPLYKAGYWNDRFIPYALLDNDTVVSSLSACVNDFRWRNEVKRYVQISTVMTGTAYRGKGLGRWLMEKVLSEWKDKCDAIYLYANDSVLDFYPKFGFEKAVEHRCYIKANRNGSKSRKLDVSAEEDRNLLLQKYRLSNPFSALTMEDNVALLMFYCMQSMRENIYYIEQYDAIVVAKENESEFVCFDIFTNNNCTINDILGALETGCKNSITLGFTPESTHNCTVQEIHDVDTTLFVIKGKENIFATNKIMFPLLSRA